MWVSLSQELMEEERNQRLRSIEAMRRQQEMLALAGYLSPADRLRCRVAALFLRVAMWLDKTILDAAPRPLRHA